MFGTLFSRRWREVGPASRRRRPWTRSERLRLRLENPSVSMRAIRFDCYQKLCLRVQLDRAQSLSTLRVSTSSPNNAAGVLQPCAPPVTAIRAISSLAAAAVRTRAENNTRTAWTVALHLSPWGAAQQIPRESRQDARTGVLWGRRAKRRQPSRPPVNRARHSQVSTDAARALKNTSAAEQHKNFEETPQGRKNTRTSRRGLDVPRGARETNQMQTFTRAEGLYTHTHPERE